MSEATKRLRKRRDAKTRLSQLVDNADNVVAIHYSCESFYDRPEGTSPRITSIAVRNLGTGQTTSFSIHQMAERDKKVGTDQINQNYDDLEKRMLKEFYDYVEKHEGHTWLHWNMRDINYGFPAIAHRYRVLGGKPFDIHESRLCDLARMLVSLYGVGYAGHPRLASVIEKNKISALNLLDGPQEAAAFESGEYVKLHQSTLRKVDVLANLAERAADGTLRTDARLREVYGGYLPAAAEMIREHWLFVLIGFVGAIASIIGLAFL
ncbi:hypothetical protein V7x_52260 [Crateriforma conspicua]|uniref:Uncharacterized protein n=1 Tax=Crateriforma conspicua TaxID=2527996 RepID=A0A5C6FK08_9PLAN|nr:hypothetical protein [Crateriforma conspicua]TWU60918.1 hypothetical protein V7x_52260 [Crateriforma conspicua]